MSGIDRQSSVSPRPRVPLLGLEFDHVTARQVVDRIMSELAAGRGGWILTPNLHVLRKFLTEPPYHAAAVQSTMRVADGMPLVWASRLRGTPLPERVAGSELIWDISARAAKEGRTLFLVGGNPGTAEQSARKLREISPDLRIVGCECPPFGFERDPDYMARLDAMLVEAQPDICYVGITIDRQEPLIARFRPLLPRTWFMGVGVSFSYVSGEIVHAPRWMRRVGLEWFYRLIQEPTRLGRRYLIQGPPFALRLLWTSWCEGRRAGVRTSG